jgi:hypothetical protein
MLGAVRVVAVGIAYGGEQSCGGGLGDSGDASAEDLRGGRGADVTGGPGHRSSRPRCRLHLANLGQRLNLLPGDPAARVGNHGEIAGGDEPDAIGGATSTWAASRRCRAAGVRDECARWNWGTEIEPQDHGAPGARAVDCEVLSAIGR